MSVIHKGWWIQAFLQFLVTLTLVKSYQIYPHRQSRLKGNQEHRFCLYACHKSDGLVVILSEEDLGAKRCITSLGITLVNET